MVFPQTSLESTSLKHFVPAQPDAERNLGVKGGDPSDRGVLAAQLQRWAAGEHEVKAVGHRRDLHRRANGQFSDSVLSREGKCTGQEAADPHAVVGLVERREGEAGSEPRLVPTEEVATQGDLKEQLNLRGDPADAGPPDLGKKLRLVAAKASQTNPEREGRYAMYPPRFNPPHQHGEEGHDKTQHCSHLFFFFPFLS